MQSVDDSFCDVGVVFECLEDAHQNRLRFGTVNTAVAVAVFTQHHRTGATFVNHIIRGILRRKRPQPMRLTVDSPACFVGVHDSRCFHHLTDFFVPAMNNRKGISSLHFALCALYFASGFLRRFLRAALR